MDFSLSSFIEKITFQEPRAKDNLVIFPLMVNNGEEELPVYLLLEEVLEMGALEIREVSPEGNVNTVVILNNADEPVLILDGEEILGAKQNRMVNATILVAAGEKVEVPVSCVERGRWRYSSPVFNRAGAFGYSTLRRQKAQQVSESLKFKRGFYADQGALWEEIDRKQARMGISSSTDALHEVYENYEEKLENFISGLEPVPGQSGVAVFINNRFACLDLFDRPETLRKLWSKLLKSYAMEAIEAREEKKSPRKADLQKVLGAIKASECSTYPSVGLGSDLRLRGPGVTGAGLVFKEKLLHLCVFESGEEKPRSSRMGGPSRRRRNLE